METQAESIAAGGDPAVFEREVRALPASQCLLERGCLRVYWARAEQLLELLPEIGRLRERAFRAVGEGTGRARDLDGFDASYLHLFAWNARDRELAGAYRLVATDAAVAHAGLAGLYTHSLFEYSHAFLCRLGPALELGRSFVRPEYQRGSATLAALWQGIGLFVARLRVYPTLFGAVSISASYSTAARALMRAALENWSAEESLCDVVRPRLPFAPGLTVPRSAIEHLRTPEALGRAVVALDGEGKDLPVLVRRYIELGGRFIAFNVDPAFGGALDGLVAVDLRRSDPELLRFCMGPAGSASFRSYWGIPAPDAERRYRIPMQLA
jgi:putative hemolysin